MRPRIVESLNRLFDTSLFEWLIPYPAMVYALTMLVCLLIFTYRCRKDNLSQYHGLGAAIWAMIGGLIGARLFFLLLHMDQFMAHPKMIFSISGGTASWGAYLGGGLFFWAYFKYHHQSITPYSDVVASLLGLGPFIGRWSCFLNGDDFGTLSSLPWAVTYPHASIPFTFQVKQGWIEPIRDFSLSVHPFQLYLSVNGIILFFIFTLLWKRKQYQTGSLIWLFALAYTGSRFFLEYFRDGVTKDTLGLFSPPQVMTLIIIITSGFILLLKYYLRKSATVAEQSRVL
jgi:phosphatidylglycerol:prolipoprotein diacylglycerol transferase